MRSHRHKEHNYSPRSGQYDAHRTKNCDRCGDSFETTSGSEKRYCSQDCRLAEITDKVTLECVGCGETFEIQRARSENARYCSLPCMYENEYHDDEMVEINCAGCGDLFEMSRDDGKELRQCCSEECADSINVPANVTHEDVLIASTGRDAYHFPDLEADHPAITALCGTTSEKYNVKDPVVLPHHEICMRCVVATREFPEPKGGDADGD